MKSVLVVGGSYFAGRAFVEALRACGGYAPSVLNRGTRPLGLEGVEEFVCDRHDTERIARIVPARQWDAVVDFCAYRPGEIADLLASLPGSVRRYVLISTATVHRNSLCLPMREDAPMLDAPDPGPGGDYAYGKLLLERELASVCAERDIAHVCLRPAFVYGERNYAPRESYFFDLMARNQTIIVPCAPQSLFSMVSVRDLARICVACVDDENDLDGAYTVCSDELVSYDRLIEVFETISGRKLDVRRQPIRLIHAAGIPLPFPLEEHLVYSGARLKRALGYEYMSLLEGMGKTYAWHVAEGARASRSGSVRT